jgi:hypothetical protein
MGVVRIDSTDVTVTVNINAVSLELVVGARAEVAVEQTV